MLQIVNSISTILFASCFIIGGGSGTASTATAVPKFDKWGLSRAKLGSEQFQYQPVLT